LATQSHQLNSLVEELQQLVGGVSVASQPVAQVRPSGELRRPPVKPSAKKSSPRTNVSKAEKAIPLNDSGSNDKDFSDFNVAA
jgi:hypothetical protein